MRKISLCFAFIMVLVSCSSTWTNYENDYYATLEMYTETMTTVNQLASQGSIPRANYDQIMLRAKTFQSVMHTAKLALNAKDSVLFNMNLGEAKEVLAQITSGVK